MTGRTATDNRIVRHQQERDLGHDLDTPPDGDGDGTANAEMSIEERRRHAGRENSRRGKPSS
jgi:hypothetical protein